jgi:hypothetical protein
MKCCEHSRLTKPRIQTWLIGLAKKKHSSLFDQSVTDSETIFYIKAVSPIVNVIKFSSSLMKVPNKLERLSVANLYSLV